MTKLDISDRDCLVSWPSKAYDANSGGVIKHDSGFVPCLDRWLAAETSKGWEKVPELRVKIMSMIKLSILPHRAIFNFPLHRFQSRIFLEGSLSGNPSRWSFLSPMASWSYEVCAVPIFMRVGVLCLAISL